VGGILLSAKGGEHGAPHKRFWSALSCPEFPLSVALGEKHFDAGTVARPLRVANFKSWSCVGD